MKIDHIHFYVEDAKKWRDWFIHVMGFQSIASGNNYHTQTEVISSGIDSINNTSLVTFVISSPLSKKSKIADFLELHPPGVADVAFLVDNLSEILHNLLAFDVQAKPKIQRWKSDQGELSWIQIRKKSSLKHTLIQRKGKTPILPDNWINENSLIPNQEIKFTGIDHLVLNVATGELENTVIWYETVLGFQRQQTFTIQTERSGLYSQVMIHPISGVQFPVNEPLSPNSQIQEFLDINRGSGIQHLALKTSKITKITQQLKTAGLSFLKVPLTYYTQLQQDFPNLNFSPQEWQEIIEQEILVDSEVLLSENIEAKKILGFFKKTQANPLLLQIFTQPIFEKPTFFFELIERRYQARGFGEGNFRALFEAIEREQLKRVETRI